MKCRVTSDINSCTIRAYGIGSQVEFTTLPLAMLRTGPEVRRYNQLIDHVGIHGQRRLTEALNKDSLIRQKEYPMESSSKSRERSI
ncbi:hypothetical protein Taro_001454 [Colocasia esculenta]|uniref:Uncharacterized protein n=1 Tax=Colocasia esculenta TaxID=4460 RepID=A0A843TJ25_COLES|nr:hypothetical protein [Colocasia esculenta]